jgi:hypothetical protein
VRDDDRGESFSWLAESVWVVRHGYLPHRLEHLAQEIQQRLWRLELHRLPGHDVLNASTEPPDLEARFLPDLDDKGATGGECQAPCWVRSIVVPPYSSKSCES